TWFPTTEPYEPLGGHFASSPAVVHAGGGQIHVLLLGTDSALYHVWWDGTRWLPSPPPFASRGGETLGGNFTGAPVVVQTGLDQFAVFGVSRSDSSLQVKRWSGGRWVEGTGTFTPLGGQILGLPSAASVGDGTIDVVALHSPSTPYYQRFDGAAWLQNWEQFG